jgi:hypothetical protein
MTPQDLIEQQLTESLNAAHHDPRWAGSVWIEPVGRVRRAARSARTRTVVAGGVGLAVLGAGLAVGLQAITPGTDRVGVIHPAGDGSSPASGLDWLMTSRQYAAYVAAHPSPSPSRDLVASPAPRSAELDQLLSDVAAAAPDARTMREDAADGGERAHAVVWLTLADGTPAAVERYRLDYPLEAGAPTGPRSTATPAGNGTDPLIYEQFTDPATWDDGTAYTVATGNAMGYAVEQGQSPDSAWSGPVIWTVTPDGWFTSWTAPVSVDRLTRWAQESDAHFAAA